jgi:DNA-damage-inducible protein D
MQNYAIEKMSKSFDEYVHHEDGIEFWYARDLQKLLDYDKWQTFEQVIKKAKISCVSAKQQEAHHFTEVSKTIAMPKGAFKKIVDFKLTRFSCYLIAQNGDPRKEVIAFAQSYFALQTRRQELLQERIKLAERINARKKLQESESIFSKTLYERGVDSDGFARVRSKGDEVLFGGKTTSEIKKKLNVPDKRPLADFLPTVTITAKELANQISTLNVNRNDVLGEEHITEVHKSSNRAVRGALLSQNVKPEDLPPEEDLKKLKKRIESKDKINLLKGK